MIAYHRSRKKQDAFPLVHGSICLFVVTVSWVLWTLLPCSFQLMFTHGTMNGAASNADLPMEQLRPFHVMTADQHWWNVCIDLEQVYWSSWVELCHDMQWSVHESSVAVQTQWYIMWLSIHYQRASTDTIGSINTSLSLSSSCCLLVSIIALHNSLSLLHLSVLL